MAVAIRVLEGAQPAFAGMTYPRLCRLLTLGGAGIVAIGALQAGTPVGLALGARGDRAGNLLSVMVDRAWRRQGIGRKLLRAFQAAMKAAGICRLRAEYPGSIASRSALELLLSRLAWNAPQLHSVQLIGYAGAMAEAGSSWPGVRHLLAKSGRIECAPWNVRTPTDQAALQQLLVEDTVLQPPDPRQWAATLEARTSFALRHDGALVGWIIGERVSGGFGAYSTSQGVPSIHYPAAYCARPYRKGGALIAAYYRAFSAQAALFGPESRAIYRTHPGARAMLALTRRRFAPIALRLDEIMVAEKDLDRDL
jgi:GNAT superfamily N-acetyltransferase